MTSSPPRAAIGRKQFTALLAAIMALGALGIDLMLPVFDDIRTHFGLAEDATDVAQIITLYFLGMALGQILYGPFADRYGRRPVLYVGLVIYAVAAAGSALAPTLPLMLLSRFLWGIGAAGPRVMAVAAVRDVYDGDAMARAMSFIMAVFVTIPILAPSVGAAIAALSSWQVVFWFCTLYALVVGVWALRLGETLAVENRRELALRPVLGAAQEVFTSRQTVGHTMAMVFLFGAFTSYLASSELIIGEIYGRPGLFPFIFGAIAVGMGSAMLLNARIVHKVGVHQTARFAVVGYTGLALVLLVVVLSTEGRPPFWVAVIGIGAVLVIHATMFPNLNAVALEPLGHVAGMASAVIGTVSLAGGAVLGALIDRSLSGTITPLVLGMAGYGLIAAGWIAWAKPRTPSNTTPPR